MKKSTVALAELERAGGFAHLHAAGRAGSELHIDCAGAARLSAAFLGAALAAAADGALLRLERLTASAQLAVEAIDRQGVLAIGAPGRAPGPAFERPFSLTLRGDQLEVQLLTLARGVRMTDPSAHEWIRGVSCARLVIDLGSIEHLDSLLV